MNNQEEKEKGRLSMLVWCAIAFVLVVFVIVSNKYFVEYYYEKLEERSFFGSEFGLSNAIFSGLAFGGIIITLIFQSQELKLQRKELKDSREVFTDQKNLMDFQRVVDVFFKMIENHRQMLNSVTLSNTRTSGGNDEVTGYLAVKKMNISSRRYLSKKSRAIHYLQYSKGDNLGGYEEEEVESNFENLEQVFSDIVLIIKYVETYLNNDLIYHEIFYHSLSKDEKHFFCMYCQFKKRDLFERYKAQIYFDGYFSSKEDGFFDFPTENFKEFPLIKFIYEPHGSKLIRNDSNEVILDKENLELRIQNINNVKLNILSIIRQNDEVYQVNKLIEPNNDIKLNLNFPSGLIIENLFLGNDSRIIEKMKLRISIGEIIYNVSFQFYVNSTSNYTLHIS